MPAPTAIFSPIQLLIIVIIIGYSLGRMKVCHISLGMAGVLFTAIVAGFILSKLEITDISYMSGLQETMKTASTLGTSMFISVVGIQTGYVLNGKTKTNLLALFVGSMMTVSGIFAGWLIHVYDTDVNRSILWGIICGSLTSTPGLSSVCELPYSIASDAVWGYSCTYLGGVISAVITARCLTDAPSGVKQSEKDVHGIQKHFPELVAICMAALSGNLIGCMAIPGINLSIGTTGGILCMGMLLGWLLQKRREGLEANTLGIYRNLGLALFFSGTGITAGLQIRKIQASIILYGILITWAAMATGLLMSRCFFRRLKMHSGCVVSGGLTSSPALGVLVQNDMNLPISQYTFSYFGALLTMILLIQLIG